MSISLKHIYYDYQFFCYWQQLARAKCPNSNYIIYFLVVNNSLTHNTKDKSELFPNEMASLRCILDKRIDSESKTKLVAEYLRFNLSCHSMRAIQELTSNNIFQMREIGNFLFKNKAKYLPFTQQNITNDDLNSVLHANNRHMTICLNWKASISDNGKFLRDAFGQHFVHVDHLFES